jgi:hypothetical protein
MKIPLNVLFHQKQKKKGKYFVVKNENDFFELTMELFMRFLYSVQKL